MPATVYLLGDPVAHSLSPLIHNAAFVAAGIDAEYRARRVVPEELGEAVAALREPGVLGANVTIPHKQAVIEHLDALAPAAEAIGAVNTVVRREDGSLLGDNTDAAGFLHGLEGADNLRGTPAVVLGSGGAARAVVCALLTDLQPESLTIAARSPEKAEALAAAFAQLDPEGTLRVVSLGAAGAVIREGRLVVNATPVGMHPDEAATPWPDVADFGPAHTVYDLIYAPAETRLLREAAAHGARTIRGMKMLVGQAAASFARWTGTPMPLGPVYSALRDHLAR
jgi:shikimate dehydrogenase